MEFTIQEVMSESVLTVLWNYWLNLQHFQQMSPRQKPRRMRQKVILLPCKDLVDWDLKQQDGDKKSTQTGHNRTQKDEDWRIQDRAVNLQEDSRGSGSSIRVHDGGWNSKLTKTWWQQMIKMMQGTSTVCYLRVMSRYWGNRQGCSP